MSEAPATPPEAPAQGPSESAQSWDHLFAGENPAKVRDALEHAREWERRAKDNKSAADELARIKDAQRTDAEKATAALQQAQADAESARAELLRYQIAATHGITDADDIALFLTGNDEQTLTRQATRLLQRTVDDSKPRSPRPDPTQGRANAGPASTADQFAGVAGPLLH